MKKQDVVEKTIKVYEKNSDKYAKHYMRDERKGLHALFIKKIKGKKILDIGCGPGTDAFYFSEKGFNVTGIDLTEKFLEIASKKAPKAQFLKMDMRKLDFPDKSFDGIWANVSFLHLPKNDGKNALIEFFRVLKHKGLLYISVKSGKGQGFVAERTKDSRFFSFYSLEEIRKTVESCGFKVLDFFITPSRYSEKRKFINIFAIKQ